MIRRIAILTGDDDVPGINAAIRAATRMALHQGWEVTGVCDGYAGLVAGEFIPLTARTVEGIIHWGGTLLGSINNIHVSAEAGQKLALDHLAKHEIDALVVIGSDKTQAGAQALAELGFPVNGVAASVENDLAGFDMIVGVDTAMSVALDTIDHLKATRSDDGDTFIVEVAGHRCGYLALMSGIASGAEATVIPEVEMTPEQIAEAIKRAYDAGRIHPIVVVAEGAAYDANRLRRYLAKGDSPGRKVREARVGYLQRRASPSAFDRMLGTRLGAGAVDALARGESGVLAGSLQGAVRMIPFAEVVGRTGDLDAELIRLANILSISDCAVAQAH